jgi:hypothetical protein
MAMRILGINDQHNASACLLEDGVVVAAVQEERFSRIKNHFCFPERSIAWLLASTEVRPDELDAVAIASEHTIGAFTGRGPDPVVRAGTEPGDPAPACGAPDAAARDQASATA